MAKVEFADPIASVRGVVLGSDPYYFRRYPARDGKTMHIVQSRPDRSRHQTTAREAANRRAFGERFGKGKHDTYVAETMRGQQEIAFPLEVEK